MKKLFTSILLAVALLCALAIPAFAVVEEENMDIRPISVDLNEEDIPEGSDFPMPRMSEVLLHSYQLSELNNGREYIWSGKTFSGKEFPKKVLHYATDLTTTGSGTTVNVGLATYFWQMDGFGVSADTVTKTGLHAGAYGYPNIQSEQKYRLCIQNKTGGVIRGLVRWGKMI